MRNDIALSWAVEQFNGPELDVVKHAYEFALEAHDGQLRASGEPYVLHCVEVGRMLSELGLDYHTVAAGLLHDIVEDTEVSVNDVRKLFDDEIARLVDGVTKLAYIDTMSKVGDGNREDQEAESLRKMFLAMVDDVRVVLIKLADRLHNMRTLASLPPEKRERIARETLEIYAPLANRLGIWQIKWELEDLGLRHYDPETYHFIAGLIAERREYREKYLQRVIAELQTRLRLEGISAEIVGRPKHIYSIYRKMRRKGVEFDQIHDVRGIRVVVDSVQDCYGALGVVHSLWKPIPGQFDDFIATPKDNMYQSLHTAVVGPEGKTVEAQIRSSEMHRRAELGIAAHWRYKEGARRDVAFENKVAWLRSLMDWRSDVEDAQEFVDTLKSDVLDDRVYVFTPKGKVLDLPAGSTPVDFAYYIHTEVGHRCRGARVNGQLVQLTRRLENGDQVEIITAKRGGPSRDWLRPDLGYTRSVRSRQKIRRWFRQQNREENIAFGREQLRRELKRLNLADDIRYQEIAALFEYKSLDDFYAAIGFGDISSQRVAARILHELRREEVFPEEEEVPIAVTPEGIRVKGVGDLYTQLAQCCKPEPDDPSPIVGYVTRGRGVTIHKWDCPNILVRTSKGEMERLVEVDWGQPQNRMYPVLIKVRAWDRDGLLRDIATVIAEEGVNMREVNSASVQKTNLATLTATLEITAFSQLISILDKIERLPNVIEVTRQPASRVPA
ncbi:MAG: bifunctional (p)ppGpp synthetase/guanosine-3',5'-bis(diphosphate) 3'-pyrophosphohydrolase [Anaerolineae bacterium]|nr:bifunctional (p)ppGpp synthetase/guanosine-3',5'-bis(diphosphate) 3'-pyrophosphohydrolase [Anaerolineae bacterium]